MTYTNFSSEQFPIKNLKVFCDDNELKRHPVCPHGPTLLFRATENGNINEYYACSAFRNRKGCSFYLLKDDWNVNNMAKNSKTFVDVEKIKILRDNVYSVKKEGLCYCHQCNEVFHKFFNADLHRKHDTILNISVELIKTPTKFLRALNNDKAQAQYFFKETTLDFFVTMLGTLKISKVVCIGVPRLHEHLKKHFDIFKVQSILLDLDHRFFYFNSDSEYFLYNMFNNHFFEGQNKKELFKRFLTIENNESILVVTDPPFGCRTEPLVNTLREIALDFRNVNKCIRVLPIAWVFPYYMENYIKNEMPEMEMLDYKINYTNHENYSDGINSRKYGSPVRLFTNIPLKLIKLPTTENYKKCNICQKWTYPENIHCNICNTCPSKNGEKYRHCNLCAMCVKPNYIHCKNCRRCVQKENHDCKIFQKNVHCWICKRIGHLELSCDRAKEKLRNKILKYKEKNVRVCLICFQKGHNENKCKNRKNNSNQ